MLFTGQHEHTIDAKKRLAIPAEFRSQWRTEVDGAAWFAVPWLTTSGLGVIRLYTERDFHAKAVDLYPVRDGRITPFIGNYSDTIGGGLYVVWIAYGVLQENRSGCPRR